MLCGGVRRFVADLADIKCPLGRSSVELEPGCCYGSLMAKKGLRILR